MKNCAPVEKIQCLGLFVLANLADFSEFSGVEDLGDFDGHFGADPAQLAGFLLAGDGRGMFLNRGDGLLIPKGSPLEEEKISS